MIRCRYDKLCPGDIVIRNKDFHFVISIINKSNDTYLVIMNNGIIKNYNEFSFVTVWVIR